MPESVARAQTVEPSKPPREEQAQTPDPPETLAASVIPMRPLLYTPPRGFEDAGLERFVQDGPSAGGPPAPLALAPDHVGLTVQATPTLY